MNKKVVCYIQAFDAEKTIAKTLQSVLNQTYKNWICFILSNGNENRIEAPNWTYDIIKEFSKKDARFIVLNKKYNNVDIYIPMLYYLANNFYGSYICSIDADDEYKPRFFEDAVSLAEQYNLDIVACGTDIILKERVESACETLISKRKIENNLIIDKKDFANKFQSYKPFFNEMWGKLYNSRLFVKKHNEKYAKKHFFRRFLPDTLFTIDTLSRADKIGILADTHHKFYQFKFRPNTNATLLSNAVVANKSFFQGNFRMIKFSVNDTYRCVILFLQLYGQINCELYEYMQAVLFGWFNDLYWRTLLHITNEKRLVELLEYLIFDENFDRVMFYNDSGKYDILKNYKIRLEYCKRIRNMILMQKYIKNSGTKYNNQYCSKNICNRIDKLVKKLDKTIKILSILRKGKCNVR